MAKLYIKTIIFSLLLLGSVRGLAHPMDLANLRISPTQDRLRVTLHVHELAAKRILGDATTIEAEPLFRKTIGQLPFTVGDKPCTWTRPELRTADSTKDFFDLTAIAICTSSYLKPFFLQLDLPFLKNAPKAFQLLVEVDGGEIHVAPLVMNSSQPYLEIGESPTRGWLGFIRMGMAHIGVLESEWHDADGRLRFPEGIDHIFFVLVLILASLSAKDLLKSITGFSVGHSITLGLSAFQVIHIHSAWVEVAIAFSIAYTAIVSLRSSRPRGRWLVATVFGTIHGLGFASALQDLNLTGADLLRALIGFNLGIEAGQLIIVSAVAPLLYLAVRRSEKFSTLILKVGNWALLFVSGYWFLSRLLYAL